MGPKQVKSWTYSTYNKGRGLSGSTEVSSGQKRNTRVMEMWEELEALTGQGCWEAIAGGGVPGGVAGGRQGGERDRWGLVDQLGLEGCSFWSSAWSGLHGTVEERGQSPGGEKSRDREA